MGMEGPILKTEEPQALPEEGIDLSRRNFLKAAAVGAVSLLINPNEAFGKQEKKVVVPEVPVEKIQHRHERKISGEDRNLEALHQSVSNGFEKMIDREIKDPSKKLAVSNFRGHIGRKDGQYVLTYSVDLTPVEKEENAHRVFGVRGRVCGLKDAKNIVHDLYDKTIPPWQERMREGYPDFNFTNEVKEDGNDNVYHKTCVMKGSKK